MFEGGLSDGTCGLLLSQLLRHSLHFVVKTFDVVSNGFKHLLVDLVLLIKDSLLLPLLVLEHVLHLLLLFRENLDVIIFRVESTQRT